MDATPAQFRRHVETLARLGTPIGMETLIRALDGAALPPNPVMITFDDGYRSCRDVALPILRALGIPANHDAGVLTTAADVRNGILATTDKIMDTQRCSSGSTAIMRYVAVSCSVADRRPPLLSTDRGARAGGDPAFSGPEAPAPHSIEELAEGFA